VRQLRLHHPWEFSGDCRDESNRFGSPEDYAAKLGINTIEVEVRDMDEMVLHSSSAGYYSWSER